MRGYWYPFYDKSKQDYFFYDDVHLSQIVRHFEFDNSLRILVFDAISRIEISVRTRFIYELATEYGPFPFKKENFVFKTESAWVKSYEKLLEDISHSKEEYIRHYRDTYQEEIPNQLHTCGRCIWCSSCLKTNGSHMRLCKNEQVEHKSYYNIVKPSKEACRLWQPSLRDITEDEKDSSLFDDFGTIPTPRK